MDNEDFKEDEKIENSNQKKEKLPIMDNGSQDSPENPIVPIKIERHNRRKSTFVDVEKPKRKLNPY